MGLALHWQSFAQRAYCVESFAVVPTAVGLLLHAWKITKAQADRKFQKLVEDGIEPHPGPSSSLKQSRKSLKIGSLNTGRAPGVWRAIDTLLPDLDVLCLQEASLQASELAAACRTLQQKGYSCFFAPGQSTGWWGAHHCSCTRKTQVHQLP